MIQMLSKKLINIAYSILILAAWTSIVLLLSAKANSNSGDISALYFWAKTTSLMASFAGLALIALRIFKKIDRDRNFLYAFLGTANIALGLCGVLFYFLHKINIIGLHDLLPNLLIGVVVMADIFLFNFVFKKEEIQ
jgi:hypothetical protein